jgi:hypothetical protein
LIDFLNAAKLDSGDERTDKESNRGNGGFTTETAELTETFRFFLLRFFSVASDGSVVPFAPLPHLPPLTTPPNTSDESG